MVTIGLQTVGESHPSNSPFCDYAHHPIWSTLQLIETEIGMGTYNNPWTSTLVVAATGWQCQHALVMPLLTGALWSPGDTPSPHNCTHLDELSEGFSAGVVMRKVGFSDSSVWKTNLSFTRCNQRTQPFSHLDGPAWSGQEEGHQGWGEGAHTSGKQKHSLCSQGTSITTHHICMRGWIHLTYWGPTLLPAPLTSQPSRSSS